MKTALAAVIGGAAAGGLILVACADSQDERDIAVHPDGQTIPSDEASTDGGDACGSGGCVDAAACADTDFCAVSFPVSRLVALNAVWGTGPSDVWAVGTRGTVLHGDGATFRAVAVDPTGSAIFVGVWGSSASDVWLLGPSAPLRGGGGVDFAPVTGSSWNESNVATGRLWAGTRAGARTWLVGESTRRFGAAASIWSLDADADGGPIWAPSPACAADAPCVPALRGLWAADATAAWAVGFDGGAFVYDGSVPGARWMASNSRTRAALSAVWGSSPSDVWAVGERGTIVHTAKGEGGWTPASPATDRDLHGVWGTSPTNVWAVGDDGTVLHFDGASWSGATITLDGGDEPTHLLGIWGSGPDDVWIVGEGVILHRGPENRRRP